MFFTKKMYKLLEYLRSVKYGLVFAVFFIPVLS